MVTYSPTRSARIRAAALAVALIVGGMSLVGCFPVAPEATPSATPAPTATEDVNGLPEGVQQATDVPIDVPNTPELRADVELTTCEEAEGGWQSSGTVTNLGTDARDYTITVFFTTDGGTVIGVGDTSVSVAAGESEDWSITAALTPAPKTVCVLRGVG